MRKAFFLFLIFIFAVSNIFAQTISQKRAATMKIGMNLSYLDNWWLGSKAKNYADFVKPAEAAKREKMFADIANNGFKTAFADSPASTMLFGYNRTRSRRADTHLCIASSSRHRLCPSFLRRSARYKMLSPSNLSPSHGFA